MRYYGTEYRDNLTGTIDKVKASVDSETYSSEINSVYVASKNNYLKEQAQGTASNAITSINAVRTKFDNLRTTIEGFYGDVDTVSAGMSEKIAHIQTLLEGVTSSMNEMTSLLNNRSRYNGAGVTSAMINQVCSKLDETEEKDFLYFRDCYYEKFMDKNGKINESAVDDYVEMFNKNRGIPNSARERAMLAAFNDATFIYLTDKNTKDSDVEDLFNMYMAHFMDQNFDLNSVSDQVLVEYCALPDKNGDPTDLHEVVWFNYSMNFAGATFIDTFRTTLDMAYYVKPSDMTSQAFGNDYKNAIVFSDCLTRIQDGGGNIALPYFIDDSDMGYEAYQNFRKTHFIPGAEDYTEKFFLDDNTRVKTPFNGRFKITTTKSTKDFWDEGVENNTPYYISTITFKNSTVNNAESSFCEFSVKDGEIENKRYISSTSVYSWDMKIGEDLHKFQDNVDKGFYVGSKKAIKNTLFLNVFDGINTTIVCASNGAKIIAPDSTLGDELGQIPRIPTSGSPIVFFGQTLTSAGYVTKCPYLFIGGAVVSLAGNIIGREEANKAAEEYNEYIDDLLKLRDENIKNANLLKNTQAVGSFYINDGDKNSFVILPTAYINPAHAQVELCYYGINHKDVGMLSFDNIKDPQVARIMTETDITIDEKEFTNSLSNYFDDYCEKNNIEGIDVYSLTNEDIIKVCEGFNNDWYHDGTAAEQYKPGDIKSEIDIPGLDMSKYTYSGE